MNRPPTFNPDTLTDAEVYEIVQAWVRQNFQPAPIEDEKTIEYENRWEIEGTINITSILEENFGDILDARLLNEVSTVIGREQTLHWLPSSGVSEDELLEDSEVAWHAHESALGDREPVDVVIAAHHRMLAALVELESVLAQASPISSRIGGNFPPEDIGTPPYTEADDRMLRTAIDVLRRQPPAPASVPPSAEAAVEVVERQQERISAYLLKIGDVAVTKFAEQLGKTAGLVVGGGMAGAGVWALLSAKLQAVAESALNWFEAIRVLL